MINFTRSFNLAWERMAVILFQPFDLGKWFTIGFSAFLAGLAAGGNGLNGSYNGNSFNRSNWNFSYGANINTFNHGFNSTVTNLQGGLPIPLLVVIGCFILAFVTLFYWLGARGQFLFLDNVVRNRGAIVWPWKAYARQANSLFGFFVAYLVVTILVFLPIAVVDYFAAMPFVRQHRWPEGGEIPLYGLLALISFLVMLALGLVLFLFRELGVPLMFRHGLLATAAFGELVQLVLRHPGAIFLFLLLRFALFIALAVLSVAACCCFCLGAIPYIGTVMLLPALIYIKCFTLDFLAQFGPAYDVWTVDVPPASAS